MRTTGPETGDTCRPEQEASTKGPSLGTLIDAYLEDYDVRRFRSISTARGRVAHLANFFGREIQATAITTPRIRHYQLARRDAGAATATISIARPRHCTEC